MKSIIRFTPVLSTLLVAHYGQPTLDRLINNCQSAMNDPETVTAREKETKRGGVKGGNTYGETGVSKSKDMKWSETTPTEYTAKQTVPIEFVKFSDRLERLFRDCGQPSGPLTIDVLPGILREWADKVHAKVVSPAPAKPEAKPAKNGGKAASNGHRETAPVGA